MDHLVNKWQNPEMTTPRLVEIRQKKTTDKILLLPPLQSGAARHSQGFVNKNLGSSPGWWAATVATYCASRPGELPKFLSSKPCEWRAAPLCTWHDFAYRCRLFAFSLRIRLWPLLCATLKNVIDLPEMREIPMHLIKHYCTGVLFFSFFQKNTHQSLMQKNITSGL